MGKLTREDYEATNFLGGILGAKEPLLKKMAMQRQREREMIGDIESLKILIDESTIREIGKKGHKRKVKGILLKLLDKPENEEITPQEAKELLDRVFVKVIELQGLAGYKQGEVTNLSMRIGSTKKNFRGGFDEKFE